MRRAKRYTLKVKPVRPSLRWKRDSDGDWQLYYRVGREPEHYWGMVCPHGKYGPGIYADGKSLWHDGDDTLRNAKEQAELFCIEDVLRRSARIAAV